MNDRPTDPLIPSGTRYRVLATALRWVPPLRYVRLQRGYLRASGWAASAWANAPVDAAGEPIPWYTYSALAFLAPRLRAEMEVFEYGAGNSTLWWAKRVSHVDAVESDPSLVKRLRPQLPPNVDLRSAPLGGGYRTSALNRGRRFDAIVIDGFERNECIRAAMPKLKEDGVVVWDNADWEHLFADGLRFVSDAGFRRIDFDGLGPLNGYGWRTTLFYRSRNCLGI